MSVEGVYEFTLERSLADKINVMYTDFRTISRRTRDIYDIFLITSKIGGIKYDVLLNYIERLGINIDELSVLEHIIFFEEDDKKKQIVKKLEDFLKKNGDSEDIELSADPKKIISYCIKFLETVRYGEL